MLFSKNDKCMSKIMKVIESNFVSLISLSLNKRCTGKYSKKKERKLGHSEGRSILVKHSSSTTLFLLHSKL